MQNDLIKQSIADAKALKQSAYELAKEQIAETFGPRVQEMIRLKLSEVEDETLKEDDMAQENVDMAEEGKEMQDENLDEVTLDEILAELDEEDDKDDLPASPTGGEYGGEFGVLEKKGKEHHEDTVDEADDEEAAEGEEEEAGEAGEQAEEDEAISVEELKDIIRDVVMDAMGMSAQGGDDTLEPEAGLEGGEDGPIDLGGGEESVDEITLDEILASLGEGDEEAPVMEKKEKEEDKEKVDELKDQLQEALRTIKTLRNELSEINLLNAKLLYVNKIFKGKALTNEQKVNVINAFDRAESVKEAKKIYETLSETITAQSKKGQIKESIGFASKASGIIPKQQKPIVQEDDIVNRWQVLAGIKRNTY